MYQASDQQQNNKCDTEVLFKLLVVDSTCALDASRASSLTHKHAHMTEPKELECASGMNISRH